MNREKNTYIAYIQIVPKDQKYKIFTGQLKPEKALVTICETKVYARYGLAEARDRVLSEHPGMKLWP